MTEENKQGGDPFKEHRQRIRLLAANIALLDATDPEKAAEIRKIVSAGAQASIEANVKSIEMVLSDLALFNMGHECLAITRPTSRFGACVLVISAPMSDGDMRLVRDFYSGFIQDLSAGGDCKTIAEGERTDTLGGGDEGGAS